MNSLDPRTISSLVKNKRTTLERIEKYISPLYFTDVNLYGRIYPLRKNVDISHWKLPGKPGAWEEWKFNDILKQNFVPAQIGEQFGSSWSTHWFKLSFKVPDQWAGKRVHLRWKSQSEAMIWSPSGCPLQGLSTGTSTQMRTDFCISSSWKINSDEQILFIEMAGSRMFGLGKNGMINPPTQDEQFTLEMCEICVFEEKLYSLFLDLEVLHDLAKCQPDDQRGFHALYTANQIINDIIKGNIEDAKSISAHFFSKSSGQLSNTIALIGNCHIDSAWLWPYSETKRKCARSWMSTLHLMDTYSEMIFAASQAQQFAWVKEHYPHIYEKMKLKIKENKFIPVGGTWVEMDGLIPNGESFMRQFLYGQRFFLQEFGILCKEFWLPDTFGYAAQIPQICQHFNIERFLTQKMSWNLVNKFPHHTFIWEGIDGSQVIAHFPPGDSYEMDVKVDEIVRSEKNFTDKGRSTVMAFLYGFGDGGGGPTQDMLERASRLKNVDGLPKLVHMTPDQMFRQMESEKRNLCKWVGELYLELHNGTYTSQARTKSYNRKCEFEARITEFLLCTMSVMKQMDKKQILRLKEKCESAWKLVLLNQFHDVLPGSSIGLVYEDSDKLYEQALELFNDVRSSCLVGQRIIDGEDETKTLCGINSHAQATESVFWLEDKFPIPPAINTQVSQHGICVAARVEPLSFDLNFINVPALKFEHLQGNFLLENQYLQALISPYGEILSLRTQSGGKSGRDAFSKPSNSHSCKGNLITIYDDVPLYWDAWDIMDYHLETRKVLNSSEGSSSIQPIQVVESGPLYIKLQWKMTISKKSSLTQTIDLRATSKYLNFTTSVDWNESHKLLKVEFETGLLTTEAVYDMQFGFVRRPTHVNTSWDTARYEVCGHKWACLSEFNGGLAVLNDSKYGWSAKGGTLCLSLLRAPKAPDDNCDIGHQDFCYAAMPFSGSFQESKVIETSYEYNSPVFTHLRGQSLHERRSWFNLEGDGIILEACKLSEEDCSKVILRLYETYGGLVKAKLSFPPSIKVKKVEDCNGLENVKEGALPFIKNPSNGSQEFSVTFTPFQIRTLKLTF